MSSSDRGLGSGDIVDLIATLSSFHLRLSQLEYLTLTLNKFIGR